MAQQQQKRIPAGTITGEIPLEAAKAKHNNFEAWNKQRHERLVVKAKETRILRKCRICGKEATNEKELELFVLYSRGFYKHDNLCKECKKTTSRQRYYENKEKWLKQTAKYAKKHQKQKSITHKRYVENHHEKILAEKMAQRHIALAQSCSICGSTENLHRHHSDYSKPLEVITLCHKCHMKIHRKEMTPLCKK